MILNRITTIALLILTIAGACWSASPSQVGTYVGTLKQTIYFTGGKSTLTSQLAVTVSADDSTTFTVDGGQWGTQSNYYNSTDGVAILTDPSLAPNNNIFLAVFNIKGSSLKGTLTGLVNTPTIPAVFISAREGKFKLKKL